MNCGRASRTSRSSARSAGEAAALRAEEDRLANADALHGGATTAHEALLGDPTAGNDGVDAVTLLGHARRALDAVRRHDTEIDGVANRLSEAAYLVSEVAGELASYIQGIDADPARLAAVQDRRATLARIIRLYGPGGVNAQIDGTPVTLGAAAEPGDADRPAADGAAADGSAGSATAPEALFAAGEPDNIAEEPDDIAYVLEWARLAAVRVDRAD